jgi:asparagine synthase (glutamine-hydrolysing)
LARRRVTVALSGDGGDELFGGYQGYVHALRLWRHMQRIPRPVRTTTGRALGSVPPQLWNRLGRVVGARPAHSTVSDKIAKGAKALAARSPVEIGRIISDRWDGERVVLGSDGRSSTTSGPHLPPLDSLMAADMAEYLPDDILVKVDRAAMAVSLETRAPFLDHRVVEFAWRLPPEMKIRDGKTKWILRRLLARHVPEELFERPKRGFSIPVDEWLRGPLRSWAEELLAPSRLLEEGFFRPEPIRLAWEAHLSGRSNRQAQLWTVLMFEAWLNKTRAERNTSGDSAARLVSVA